MFIQTKNKQILNKALIQTLFIDPRDESSVIIYMRNGEPIKETYSSAAEATSTLNYYINLLLTSGPQGGAIEIVDELPAEGRPNTFYLVPKTETSTNDLFDEFIWINKGTIDNPDYGWEWIATKQVSLENYVQFDNYASTNKGGVSKVNSSFGININGNGALYIARASDGEIEARTNVYKPITPASVDYSVKQGIINAKIEWSDEEKLAMRNFFNIVGKNDIAGINTYGVIKFGTTGATGLGVTAEGVPYISKASNAELDLRTSNYKVIVPSNFDYAYDGRWKVVTAVTNNVLTLTNKQEARLGTISNLTLSLPSDIDDKYESVLGFSVTDSIAITYGDSTKNIKWVGDDCNAAGQFTPEPLSNYDIYFKYLGKNANDENIIVARVGAY